MIDVPALITKSFNMDIYERLHEIYKRYQKLHPENPDSKQMCCMWSTDDPPDIIETTPPYYDILDEFDLDIDEQEGWILYDMYLREAAEKIDEIKNNR